MKWRLILLLLIISLGFFLRFNKLSTVPPGLGRDEVSVGYNAYSIVETLRDEHGRFLPLYFEAIGDQKLPVLIYLTAISIKIFGLNAFGARFPYAFFGSLTILFAYFLVEKGLEKERAKSLKKLSIPIALLVAFLLAINPWHLSRSRAVYEVTLGTFFFTFGTYCFLRGLNSQRWFLLSITTFIIAFYTYSMTRLLAPLLFIFFCFLYWQEIRRFSRRFLVFSAIWASIFLMPFIATFFDPGGITSPKGAVILTSSSTRSTILDFRSYVVNSSVAFLGPFFFNRILMTLYEYGRNILTTLSPGYYFAQGSPTVVGIGTNGHFYLIEFLAFIVGLSTILALAKSESKFARLILVWMALATLTASLTISPPYDSRMLFLVVPTLIVIAFGWWEIFSWVGKKGRLFFRLAIVAVAVVYIWHFTHYMVSYYFRFPIVYAYEWEAKAKELFEYLAKYEDEVDYIVVPKPEKSPYAFLLFYRQIPPQQVWDKVERYPPDPDGWKHGKKFGKYEFRSIDWKKDNTSSTSAILVAEGGEHPERTAVTHEIFYPTRHAVYPHGQNIISHPEKRVAFRIWRVKPVEVEETTQ